MLASAEPGAAATYYVSTSGSDSSSGSQSQPWRTLKKAASVLAAGNTLYIRGGVYTETVDFYRSGTSSAPISIYSYPGETAIIDGAGYSIPANWYPLVKLSGEYITIAGIEIRYSGGMGLALSGKHNTADRINAHHNRQNGILIAGRLRYRPKQPGLVQLHVQRQRRLFRRLGFRPLGFPGSQLRRHALECGVRQLGRGHFYL